MRKNEVFVDIFNRKGGGLIATRRIDEPRAPQGEMRADLYQRGGFNHSLPDYADVRLHR